MGMYLARLARDKQIVGFFRAEDENELFWLIDECCDPNQVEIAQLGSGAIYWGESIAFTVPVPCDENGEPLYDGLPPNPSLSSGWTEALFGNGELQWHSVTSKPNFED